MLSVCLSVSLSVICTRDPVQCHTLEAERWQCAGGFDASLLRESPMKAAEARCIGVLRIRVGSAQQLSALLRLHKNLLIAINDAG